MSKLERIGVSIDAALLEKFDAESERRGYTNRSEAFRDLIRDTLIRKETAAPDAVVIGTLTIVYDHHVRQLTDKLTAVQHDHHSQIISTLHVHMDHDTCMEVVVLKGANARIRNIADQLISLKGVKHGQLTVTTG